MMNFDDYNLILDQLNMKFKKWNKVRKNRSIKMLTKDVKEWEDEISKIWGIKEHQKDDKTSTARLECLLSAENYSRIITKQLAQKQSDRLIQIEISKIRKANTKKEIK